MTLAVRDPRVPDSPLARRDARWKLAAFAAAALGVAVVRHPAAAAVAFAGALAVTRLANLPANRVLARVGLLALAVVPFVLVLPFTHEHGLSTAAAVALRCLAIGTLGLALAGSTPVPRLFAAARSLGVPASFALVGRLAHRYTFVLADEARRIRTALRARGFRPRTNALTYRTLGHAAGALVVRGGERADRVAAAMRCRGFDGSDRLLAPFRTTPADVVMLVVAVLCAALLIAWDRLA